MIVASYHYLLQRKSEKYRPENLYLWVWLGEAAFFHKELRIRGVDAEMTPAAIPAVDQHDDGAMMNYFE
jgi:hypothetical protein